MRELQDMISDMRGQVFLDATCEMGNGSAAWWLWGEELRTYD